SAFFDDAAFLVITTYQNAINARAYFYFARAAGAAGIEKIERYRTGSEGNHFHFGRRHVAAGGLSCGCAFCLILRTATEEGEAETQGCCERPRETLHDSLLAEDVLRP